MEPATAVVGAPHALNPKSPVLPAFQLHDTELEITVNKGRLADWARTGIPALNKKYRNPPC